MPQKKQLDRNKVVQRVLKEQQIPIVADEFDVHPRTIRHHLARAGVTYLFNDWQYVDAGLIAYMLGKNYERSTLHERLNVDKQVIDNLLRNDR